MTSKAVAITDGSMIEEYFSILKKYKKEYNNEKLALLYQCGSFYELYGLKTKNENKLIENEDLEDITNVCNLALSLKKNQLRGKEIYMAGVRDYVLDKYLAILNEAGYTSIIYSQHRDGIKFIRKLDSIVSRGTYISYDTDTVVEKTNNIMCIWVEQLKEQLMIGISTTNIFTGKSYFFEYITENVIIPTNFDEIERQISTFQPNELIIVSNLNKELMKNILRYSGVKCSLIHFIDLNTNLKALNCSKQSHLQHVFTSYFTNGNNIIDCCSEFMANLIATQSFCFLLDFIYEHNPNLLKNISLPVINNTSTRLILGNQTLRQLNLIDDGSIDGKRAGKYSSVLNFLNCACSPMGQRLFAQQFVNPTFDVSWLENEYNMIELIYNMNNDIISLLQSELSNIKDIEKMLRQIVMHKIYPRSLSHLYYSVEFIIKICNIFQDNFSTELYKKIMKYAEEENDDIVVLESSKQILMFFHEHFYMDKCKNIASVTTFDENFINKGVLEELDVVDNKYNETLEMFHKIHAFFNNIIQQSEENVSCGGNGEFVKIHETEKSGSTLQITKRRAIVLKNILGKKTIIEDAKNKGIDITEIKFTTAGTSSNEEIHSTQIRDICKNINILKETRNKLISDAYNNILNTLEKKYYSHIQSICHFIAKLDILICKGFIAKKYNYCRPIIQSNAEKSFVNAKGMRHVLIEHLQTKEMYVPNDVSVGKLLLYGVNTTGKTSYIRSVGISVVMAQAGLFVPCMEFTFKPYTAIFSRILGNDNLFHGLSTFAVEMSELRVILKMSDKNTLVIGDEVCSGTETQSALSIFVSALTELSDKDCSFLFATHFHEILDCDEIQELCNNSILKIAHMAVMYDREKDKLIYQRVLKEGAGYRMYGIEICKSLHLPDDFIEKAYRFRNKYFSETVGALSHKTSIYNSSKIRGICEKCGIRISEETHHIFPQKDADKITGIISVENGAVLHKNHLSNLMALCEKCHKNIHSINNIPQPIKRIIKRKKIIEK